MNRDSQALKGYLLRCTERQLNEIKHRALLSGLSVKDFILGRVLNDGHVSSQVDLEMKEQALFYAQWTVHELNKLAYKVHRNQLIPHDQIEESLNLMKRAGELLCGSFDENAGKKEVV
jgi:hypothetical protein